MHHEKRLCERHMEQGVLQAAMVFKDMLLGDRASPNYTPYLEQLSTTFFWLSYLYFEFHSTVIFTLAA